MVRQLCAADARDVLGLPGGNGREVRAPDDSPAGHRAVGLRGLRPVPGRLRQLPGPGPFREVTPVVPVNGGRKPPGTADAGRLYVSLPYFGSYRRALSRGRDSVLAGLTAHAGNRLKSFTPNGPGACPQDRLFARLPQPPVGSKGRGKSSPGQPGRSAWRSRAALPGLLRAPLGPYGLARPVRHLLPARRRPPACRCGAGPAVPCRSGPKNCSPGRPPWRGCG